MDEKSPSFYKTNSSQRSLVGSSLHRKHNIPSLDALLLRDAQLLCFRSDGKLRSADLFFIDAAKDGVMEHHFIKNLKAIGLKPNAVVLFDDIRLWNMLDIWRSIDFPKLDLTSFGHWSGTGVVQWNPA